LATIATLIQRVMATARALAARHAHAETPAMATTPKTTKDDANPTAPKASTASKGSAPPAPVPQAQPAVVKAPATPMTSPTAKAAPEPPRRPEAAPAAARPAERVAAQKPPPHDAIARRAYELWQQRGGQDGGDFDDWRRAEEELFRS
jgi:hypothetical protein